MTESKKKNIVILLFEVITVLMMVFNVLPREASWFLTGLLVFYFIFSKLEDSLWVFIASIPLFVALPIRGGFDTLANWRVLSIVLFMVLFFRYGISLGFNKWKFKNAFKYYRSEHLLLIFLLFSFLSLVVAQDIVIGLKKIIFLVNAFLIYLVIRNMVAKKKEILEVVINAAKVSIGLVLGIGFLQLIMVFFVNLHKFW